MDFDGIVDIVTKVVKSYFNTNCLKILRITEGEPSNNSLFSDLPSCSVDDTFNLGYNLDLDKYDFLIIDILKIKDIFKISNAICDNDYLSIICKSILNGKKLYIVKDSVEIFSYKGIGSSYYYKNIVQYLDIIEKSGVHILSKDNLRELISSRLKSLSSISTNITNSNACIDQISDISHKRLITQLDINSLASGVQAINVSKNCIVTDLAKDICKERSISIYKV